MIDFNLNKVTEMFDKKRQKLLIMTGEQGANIAAENSRVDTGASRNAKQYKIIDKETIHIEAPLLYDIYLERRYGIMAITQDLLMPYISRYERAVFGE